MQRHRETLSSFRLDAALRGDPARARSWRFEAAGIEADLSRNLATDETWRLLLALADAAQLARWRERLFAGEPINNTEGRPAWHTALRAAPADSGVARAVGEQRSRMLDFAERLRSRQVKGSTGKPIETVICIGIGGSDLGPRLVTTALGEASGPIRLHLVSNIDPVELDVALAEAAPESTLVVAISKSFTTLETLENARAALAWLQRAPGVDARRHLAAVTAQPERAQAFGVDASMVYTFAEWVGGRYSLWSACGLPIAVAHGAAAFDDLLRGAAALDRHFIEAPPAGNLPLLLGALGVWYVNFWGCRSRAVMPYAQRLRHLPAYLQQLEMESNGKRVDRDGRLLDHDTSPVVWGEAGTTAQHSVFQFLHQGTFFSPVDFVTAAGFESSAAPRERLLYANALAQADALALGEAALKPSGSAKPAYAVVPGNRPSTFITLPRIDAFSVGALLALYEHRTFVQGVLWQINSFDQWGVEIGKQLLKQRLAD
ncbi:MAG: glucose-6-phosphate isomerase [Burkholderiales bacterium]|nr:MAG: glucose-6-phosphate isomerase [Burkholderiales bacterium]